MINVCINCKKEFVTTQSKQKCCSRKCSNEIRHPKVIVKCDTCGKELPKTQKQLKYSKRFYCSNACKAVGVGIHQSGKNNPNYKGANTIVRCSNCNAEIKTLNCTLKNSDGSLKKNFYCSLDCKAEHQQELLKGENNPKWRGGNVECACANCGSVMRLRQYRLKIGQKHYYCSQECKAEHQQAILLGENNPNYLHGLSDEYRERYRIIEGYNTWRREVYGRDKYTCQVCNDDRGGNLNAHHLNSYDWDVDNRANVDNGITLCEDCHKEFHSKYGTGKIPGNNLSSLWKISYVNPVVTARLKNLVAP